MKRPKTLTAAFVKRVREPGRYGDGRGGYGLSLLVKGTSTHRLSKTWSQRLWLGGKAVNIGLGAYPLVTLADARLKALENKRAVLQGRDPRTPDTPTFAEAAARVIDANRPHWKGDGTAKAWERTLRRYAFPSIGGKRVDAITSGDVLAIVLPLWSAKRATGKAVRQRVAAVLAWCIAEGHRRDNPADEIRGALPKNGNGSKHHRAVHHRDVAGVLARVDGSKALPVTRAAFRFLVLTASRVGEVIGLTWAEVDTKAGCWRVPASRMKTGREHRVPLSGAALAVLEAAKSLRGYDPGGLVFRNPVTGRKLSRDAFSVMLRRLRVRAVPHGFRSSFRCWCADTGADRELAEAALAHVVRGVEGAYMRSDVLERRRELMEEWSKYLAG